MYPYCPLARFRFVLFRSVSIYRQLQGGVIHRAVIIHIVSLVE